MDLDYLSRVLVRLRPFVRERVIRRTRLERVLGALDIPADTIRPEIERFLATAKIRIDEDQVHATAPIPPPMPPEPARLEPERVPSPGPPPAEAKSASHSTGVNANWRSDNMDCIKADRHVANHASILLAQQEVGLAILIRGRSGRPLEQGEFASLTGEAREAAECLFLHNQRLVHSVAKKYPQTGMSYDDIVQHGMTGLIRAVELSTPGRATNSRHMPCGGFAKRLPGALPTTPG